MLALQTSDTDIDEQTILADELPHLKGKIATPFDELTKEFIAYLMGPGGKLEATAKDIKQDVLKYFHYTIHVHPDYTSLPYKDIILNKHYLHEYFNYLQMNAGLQPSTIMNKLQKLVFAIEFVEFLENPDGTNEQVHCRCEAIIGALRKWKKSLYRPRSKQRSHQYEVSTAKVHFIHLYLL